MKVTAIAPWFGGKRTLAPQIVEQLGPHRCYWEPFCGSMAVLLAKDPAGYESVNDLHGDLVNLGRCLQDPQIAEQLYDRTYRTIVCEQFARDAKRRLRTDEACPDVADPERAYWYLIYSWFHINGAAGTPMRDTGTFCVRYSSKGGNGAVRWRSVVDSIPAWHERLRGVQILSRDGFELLPNIEDADGTVMYVDPPYVKKGARYVHDFERADHERLAEVLKAFRKTRVVLSYYEDPLVNQLYGEWSKIDQNRLCVAKSLVNSAMRDQTGTVQAPEMLLVNGPLMSADPKELFA